MPEAGNHQTTVGTYHRHTGMARSADAGSCNPLDVSVRSPLRMIAPRRGNAPERISSQRGAWEGRRRLDLLGETWRRAPPPGIARASCSLAFSFPASRKRVSGALRGFFARIRAWPGRDKQGTHFLWRGTARAILETVGSLADLLESATGANHLLSSTVVPGS